MGQEDYKANKETTDKHQEDMIWRLHLWDIVESCKGKVLRIGEDTDNRQTRDRLRTCMRHTGHLMEVGNVSRRS